MICRFNNIPFFTMRRALITLGIFAVVFTLYLLVCCLHRRYHLGRRLYHESTTEQMKRSDGFDVYQSKGSKRHQLLRRQLGMSKSEMSKRKNKPDQTPKQSSKNFRTKQFEEATPQQKQIELTELTKETNSAQQLPPSSQQEFEPPPTKHESQAQQSQRPQQQPEEWQKSKSILQNQKQDKKEDHSKAQLDRHSSFYRIREKFAKDKKKQVASQKNSPTNPHPSLRSSISEHNGFFIAKDSQSQASFYSSTSELSGISQPTKKQKRIPFGFSNLFRSSKLKAKNSKIIRDDLGQSVSLTVNPSTRLTQSPTRDVQHSESQNKLHAKPV
ncbi:hypothetical protein HELRODRAFT_191751 [Helobdella robusta]|uniref:Uncharacterized protein n=1 Tax=Helobdella robusta TaxID=6412 RepID=T1FT97_HELRO|nr:hypothetical protein HELRODRAFT_191751 [Helobdella robusta]ESO04222.1 hypothetical protein HELRODRAFT_191751 [Helobdella robusta]